MKQQMGFLGNVCPIWLQFYSDLSDLLTLQNPWSASVYFLSLWTMILVAEESAVANFEVDEGL